MKKVVCLIVVIMMLVPMLAYAAPDSQVHNHAESECEECELERRWGVCPNPNCSGGFLIEQCLRDLGDTEIYASGYHGSNNCFMVCYRSGLAYVCNACGYTTYASGMHACYETHTVCIPTFVDVCPFY